jgi:carboxyl-terminal processing protease
MNRLIFKLIVTLSALVMSTGVRSQDTLSRSQATDLVKAIHTTFESHIFDKRVLFEPSYISTRRSLEALIQDTQTKEDFANAFNQIWASGPLSHVQLNVSAQNAEQTATYLDGMKTGPQSVSLTWREGVPILAVNTMMGTDTVEAIRAAYAEIAAKGSKSLIIDLRRNTGGAFAVVPLVGHLIDEEFDTGLFVSQTWHQKNSTSPNNQTKSTLSPWKGWSIKSFWNDVLSGDGVLRIRFEPMLPTFRGSVYVLTSSATASAAELTVDALRTAKRITHIGEKTAGKMLSQKVFDVPHGFLLSLPIADYISHRSGRIEGRGITPMIAQDSALALETALELAK